MSFELIKNYLYEKNTTPSNIYIELSSFKTFSYLLIDSLLTKSKTTFSIINFDPLYYRFCLSSGKSIPKTIFDSNQTFDTLQFDNNLIIIGADLLPSDSLNNFLQTFSQKKVGTVLFITNSQSKQKENSELIRNVCSLLLIEKPAVCKSEVYGVSKTPQHTAPIPLKSQTNTIYPNTTRATLAH